MSFLNAEFLQTLVTTFELAFITTFLLFFIAVILAYLLVFVEFPFKTLVQVLLTMPLILPPSVLGFYFLVAFSPQNFFGSFLQEYFGIKLVFSFKGLVVASIIFSLPFMLSPIQSAFAGVSKNLIEVSYTLGKGKIMTLLKVIIPNSKIGIITGCVLAFAHTIGEFGVVMMIGGHKKGETLVASIALYDELEALNYSLAHQYALVLFILSFIILLSLFFINKKITSIA